MYIQDCISVGHANAAHYRAELGTNRLVYEGETREVVIFVENSRLWVRNHSESHHIAWIIAAYYDRCRIT